MIGYYIILKIILFLGAPEGLDKEALGKKLQGKLLVLKKAMLIAQQLRNQKRLLFIVYSIWGW